MNNDLLSRQMRLREVGNNGQALLHAARVTLGSDAASGVAADYLIRSGVGSVEQGNAQAPDSFPHAGHFTFPVTEQFARGAWVATQTIVVLLGLPGRKGTPE
jgi:hypothetical protein